ncbi:MAG: GTPase RsgA [Nibricoccus sp.]
MRYRPRAVKCSRSAAGIFSYGEKARPVSRGGRLGGGKNAAGRATGGFARGAAAEDEVLRRAAGSEEIEQIVAANIDTVFLVSGLDQNYNPKRIQRFLVAAKESGAEPVVLLNKSDVCDDADDVRKEIEQLVPGTPIHVTSAVTRKGLKALTATYVQPGRTLAFIGCIGCGKVVVDQCAREGRGAADGRSA